MSETEVRQQQWFDNIPPTADPWHCWFSMLQIPSTEDDIKALCRAADLRRLAIDPVMHFSEKWQRFRHNHEALEVNWEWRRLRWLMWYVGAHKVIYDRAKSQEARARLNDARNEFDPYLVVDWFDQDAFDEYAITVMRVMRGVSQS